MADWDWLPPADPEQGDVLATPVPAEPELVAWPEFLGGPSADPEAPVEPEAPAEAPAEPDPDPLGLAPVLRFPWETDADADADAGALEGAADLAVDAVSGGEPVLVPDAVSGGSPVPVADPRLDPIAVQPQDYAVQAEEERLMALTPEELAVDTARAKVARDAYLDERRAAEMRRDREAAEANDARLAKHREQARAELQSIAADAERLAATEVDPRRWWSNASTGQKIGAGVAAVIGGYLAPMRGGQNTGIDFVMGLIDRDIDAQKAGLAAQERGIARRKGLVGELYELGLDEHAAAETVRLGALAQLDQRLAAEQAQLDPAGTMARQIVAARIEVRTRQAKAAHELERQRYGMWKDLDVSERDWARIFEQERAAKAGEAQERAELAFERDKAKRAREAEAGVDPELVLGAAGELVNADGAPFAAKTKQEAVAMRKTKASVDRAVELIDEIVELRKDHGWQSDTLKGPTRRKMLANLRALQLLVKNTAELGVLAGEDMPILEGFIGTDDPTELRDPTPGLQKARENITKGFDSDLRSQGYTGPVYRAKRADAVRDARRAYKPESASDFAFLAEYGRPAAPGLGPRDPLPAQVPAVERAEAFLAAARMKAATDGEADAMAWAERVRATLPDDVIRWINTGDEQRAAELERVRGTGAR